MMENRATWKSDCVVTGREKIGGGASGPDSDGSDHVTGKRMVLVCQAEEAKNRLHIVRVAARTVDVYGDRVSVYALKPENSRCKP